MPDDVRALIAIARLRPVCKDLGIRRLDAGPAGTAATFTRDGIAALDCSDRDWKIDGERVISPKGSDDPAERLSLIEAFVEDLAECRDEEETEAPKRIRATTR